MHGWALRRIQCETDQHRLKWVKICISVVPPGRNSRNRMECLIAPVPSASKSQNVSCSSVYAQSTKDARHLVPQFCQTRHPLKQGQRHPMYEIVSKNSGTQHDQLSIARKHFTSASYHAVTDFLILYHLVRLLSMILRQKGASFSHVHEQWIKQKNKLYKGNSEHFQWFVLCPV